MKDANLSISGNNLFVTENKWVINIEATWQFVVGYGIA